MSRSVGARKRPFPIAKGAWIVAAALAQDGPARADRPPVLRVGSKRFTESYILAEIAVAVARRAGDATVSHEQGLGGTALAFRALEEGAIDAYPEYTGTLAEAVLHESGSLDLASLRRKLVDRGIAISEPLGFSDNYALAVTAELAEARHLTRISDLPHAPDLRLGMSPEFIGRSDGFPGLASAYGLSREHVRQIDHGLSYAALVRHSIDVMDVYSTDAQIGRYALRVLDDDRAFFPTYQAVFLYRIAAAQRTPRAMHALLGLAGAIDTRTMIALNAAAELDRRTFASVAEDFVRASEGAVSAPPQRRESLFAGTLSTIRTEGPRHVGLAFISVLLAAAVGVPLGIFAQRAPRIGGLILGTTSLVQTIPSLALLCFLIPILGTGPRPALLALFLYALLPIVRNTVAGLEGISPPLRESAEALGLGAFSRLWNVELPLASPLILAGVRTSAIISVGTATLAAFIGAGGFGAPISTGLNLNDSDLILEGAIPAALLALGVEGLFALLAITVIPRGLRLRKFRRGEHRG